MLAADVTVPLREFTLRVALDIAPDVPLALAGPSGAGKSTFLRALAGVGLPAAGTVRLGGERWLDTDAGIRAAPEQRRCALLPQHDTLFAHLPAWRNVTYGMTAVPRGRRRAEAEALLGRLNAAELADARPAELSGGERRRVALARALAAGPRALLLDEPLTGLDPVTRQAATRELRTAIAAAGVPVVIVTHELAHVATLTADVAVLERGVLVQRGTAGQLASAPASPFVAALAGGRSVGDCA